MQFVFKIIILFFIVFNFRVPVFYNSVVIALILSAIYYVFKRGSIPFTYFFQRYNVVLLIGNIAVSFVILLIVFLHNTSVEGTLEKRFWVQFMMMWAIVFALPLLIEGKESTAFEELAVIICYAYAIQGAISITAYLYEPLGDFLFEMKPEAIKESVLNPAANLDKFRLYNLSGILFVELTAAYGIAFILFFWFQLTSDHSLLSGWKKYMVLFFIFLGTILSGRTGFIGLLMGLGGWLFFSYGRIFTFLRHNLGYVIGFILILMFSYNILLSGKQRQSFDDEVFPFAFEWYYNYRDYGKLEVNSLDATTDQHYFYLYDETLLKGHGVTAFAHANPLYPHSDAGYINDLVFGGIPFLICLLIYQSLYFIRPIAIAKKRNLHKDRVCIAFLLLFFLYILILEIKTPALGSLHVAETMFIAIGSCYIIQYYLQNEQIELEG